jgi:hypothetical protein
MPPVGFLRAILAGDRPQNHALDRAATGPGRLFCTFRGFGSTYGQAKVLGLNKNSSERMAGAFAPVIRWPGRVAGNSPPFRPELKNEWSSTSSFLCDFKARTDTTLRIPRPSTFLLSLTGAPLVSRDVSADEGFPCDSAIVLGAAIRETL